MPEENVSVLAAEANRLYWQSTRPAGQLADELGISRSKFYALIEPLHLPVTCEVCGSPLTFSSRTDREAGRGRCQDCGHTADVPLDEIPSLETPIPAPQAAENTPDVSMRELVAGVENRQLWISALAGLAAGLLAGAWWRKR